jgi:tetratricopeptide (TPR) repeat protein
MLRSRLILVLIFVVCFCLGTYLGPRQTAREAAQGRSGSVLVLLLGDGRKMFANHFFAKADGYFHRGVYPSIFEAKTPGADNHMTEETETSGHGGHEQSEGDHGDHTNHGHEGHQDHEGETHGDSGEKQPGARDWIEGLGQRFYPHTHVELSGEEAREMLPWLRLSAELDPHRVETYAVTVYWLYDRLGKVDEAEQFLRKGLKANPDNPQLMYELGRLYFKSRKDFTRTRNVWQFALRRWHQVEAQKEDPNYLILEQILGGLSTLEIEAGRFDQAIEYLKQLKIVSPVPDSIQKQIDGLSAKAQAAPSP